MPLGNKPTAIRKARPRDVVPRFELVRRVERFHEIATPWQELWLKREALAFQAHPWISEWLRHSARNCRLHIGLLWGDDARLLAVVPCAIRRTWGLRVLEWAAQGCSDYCDGFGDPVSLDACWTALLNHRSYYDLIRFWGIRSDAAIAPLLQRGRINNTDVEQCQLLQSTWPNGDEWLAAQYPKRRNNYWRGRRKLEELGRFAVEIHTTPPDGVVEHLRRLKLQWAIAQGLPAPMLENPSFFAGLVHSLAALGRLLVVVIRCGDEFVAGSIHITHNGRLLSYLATYDPKYERASPGVILLAECTRWAFNHGFTEHDFLRGAESYKASFANTAVVVRGYIGVGSVCGRAALMLRQLAASMGRPRSSNIIPPRPALVGEIPEQSAGSL
jgi:CelD/BcsL family acetyltransferase involved in cellulose biosynthesis